MDGAMFKLVLLVAISSVYCQECEVSTDCHDSEGRSLCYEKVCHKDVPCNKDNDCFFYGAADVSQGIPHPKCFNNPQARSPPGYGVCMLREYTHGLERIPGGDVIDTKEVDTYDREIDREIKTLKDMFKIIK